jgi:hypothetical protein
MKARLREPGPAADAGPGHVRQSGGVKLAAAVHRLRSGPEIEALADQYQIKGVPMVVLILRFP